MEVIVVQNDMSQLGLRTLHVMSGEPVDQVQALKRWVRSNHPYQLNVKTNEDEIRLHHLTVTWLAREALHYTFQREGTGKKHPVVVWAMEPGQRISDAAVDAALLFYGTYGFWPSAAWVRTWPKGLKEEDAFIPIGEGYGLDLFAVQWAMDGFVIVGGGFNQKRS